MTSPNHWSFRTRYLLGFLVSFGLIGFAVYLQEARGLMPCSFCILQRVAFAALGVVFLKPLATGWNRCCKALRCSCWV